MSTPKSKRASAPAVVPVEDVAAAVAVAEGVPGEALPALPDSAYLPESVALEHDPVVTYRITSRRAGFRRAGRAWSVTPTDVLADDLTAAQLAALLAEPMLTVEAL